MDEVFVIPGQSGPQPARQLGSKYFLGAPLGRGAMGVVHEATNRENEPLAVKLLRPELATDDRTVARFVQERQIFHRLNHPNVVQVHDLVAEGDQLGIVMEKVNGGDLKQRIEDRSLAPTTAMQIAADIAAGLEAIHAISVVHRDLKPANILIAEEPDGSLQPKISDFGISRLVSEAMTRTSTTIGTPLYMAPEAADKRGAHAPADVYSLGAVMFELLIGSAPFHEGGTFAVLKAHAVERPPAIGGVPAQLSELIDEMLTKEPELRPTASAVRRRLLALLLQIDDAQSPISIPRPSSDETLQVKWAAVAAADEAVTADRPASVSNDTDVGEAVTTGPAANGAAFAAVPDIASAETSLEAIIPIGGDPADSSETVTMGVQTPAAVGVGTLAGAAAVAGIAPTAPATGAPAQPMIGSFELPGDDGGDQGSMSVAELDPGVGVSSPPGHGPSVPSPDQSPTTGFFLDETDPSQSPAADPSPPAPPAPPAPPTTSGRTGGLLAGGRPKRLLGLGIAVASLTALGAITYVAITGDGGEQSESGDGGSIEAGEDRGGDQGVGSGSRSTDGDGGGQGRFSSTALDGSSGDADDSEGSDGGVDGSEGSSGDADGSGRGDEVGGGTTDTVGAPPGGSSTTAANTTTTVESVTTTEGGPSTTEVVTSTTEAPTTTEQETTTTERTTTSRPTTSTPAAVPIRIVSGPTVNVVTSSSFQFNYSTNDVCGTGSFSVFHASSGALIGSNSGNNVCFGPLHGGFPQASHPTFGGYILEPNTTYRVVVTVRGTASDGSRTAGSGSDSRSFNVTTRP